MESKASPTTLSLLTTVESALRDSLFPPEFRDVHLYAFSRRTICKGNKIKIDHPLPVIAIGSIIKNTEHFAKCESIQSVPWSDSSDFLLWFSVVLSSGFAEGSTDARTAIRQSAHPSEYDYESDSDLDEFEELEDSDTETTGPSPSSTTSSSKGKLKEVVIEETECQAASTTSTSTSKCHQVPISNVAHRT